MASGLFTLKNQLVALIQNAWSGTSPSNAPKYLEYLVVAGGGAGFYSGGAGGAGGGGAGGLLQGTYPITLSASYYVTVGAGASSGSTSNGSNSVFNATSSGAYTGNIVAIGGASPTAANTAGTSGGSGSGGGELNSGSSLAGGAGVVGQGNAGGTSFYNYCGAGGGGAGTIGLSNSSVNTPGNGGAGIASSISGSVVTYAGGGGGAGYNSGSTGGIGGVGGGGQGSLYSTTAATSGSSNTGGGGGGKGVLGSGTTAGGSGIVIVRYRGNVRFFSGGTLSYDSVNNYTVHTFYASGTLAPLATPVTYGTTSSLTKSLRFRLSNSAYLSRTPSSAGNQQIHTFSGWIKYSLIPDATDRQIISFGNGLTYQIVFGSGGTILGVGSQQLGVSNPWYIGTSQVFRDTSAWYHIVVAVNTTQATSTDRVKVYVNGTQVTSFGTTIYPTQNYNTGANSTTAHSIGRREDAAQYIDAYMAEVNWIDGQALTPQAFGQYDSTTGVWQPMTFVGTYGTNGFYLPFTNTTSTTTLGYDSSGNSNNWTTTGFSLTAGSTYDSMLDVPTLSSTASNYAVLNPNDSYTGLLSNGNLTLTSGSSGWQTARSSIYVSTGKWYWEVTMVNDSFVFVGLDDNTYNVIGNPSSSYVGAYTNSWSIYFSNGQIRNNTGGGSAYGSAFSIGDICMVALDMTNGKIYWGKNGTWFNSGNPATQTNPAYSNLSGYTLGPATSGFDSTSIATHNFGQQPFTYTPPTGFVALNTYNLPTPAIVRGNQYMDATIYNGTGGTQPIMNAGSFQPDWVWLKIRSGASSHVLIDAVRGYDKYLGSSSTAAESTSTDQFLSFNSNGFTLGANSGAGGNTNQSGSTYVGWQWKASNATAVSNTTGSITSSVSANTTSGFSVVTYTGNAIAGATVGHGLGVAPSMVIVKRRDSTSNWWTYLQPLQSITAGAWLYLNATNGTQTTALAINAPFYQAVPTSSVFSIAGDGINTLSATYVAYCFAAVAGYSAFGSYTGNGSADGPFVYLGFRPRWVMMKRTDSSPYNWVIVDTARNTYNVADAQLSANLSNAENTSFAAIDFNSNGFKMRATDGAYNSSGGTYIYMAFAENPFRNALAR